MGQDELAFAVDAGAADQGAAAEVGVGDAGPGDGPVHRGAGHNIGGLNGGGEQAPFVDQHRRGLDGVCRHQGLCRCQGSVTDGDRGGNPDGGDHAGVTEESDLQ